MTLIVTKVKCKVLLSCFISVLEEKQKSDAEEDGGTVSQEEDDRKPKAEVKEGVIPFLFHTTKLKVHFK
jgi:hypothetical protein